MIKRHYRTSHGGCRCITPCPFFAPIKVGTEACAECPYRVDRTGDNIIICAAHETSMGIRPKVEDTSDPQWWGFRYARFQRSKNELLKTFRRLGELFEKSSQRLADWVNGDLE